MQPRAAAHPPYPHKKEKEEKKKVNTKQQTSKKEEEEEEEDKITMLNLQNMDTTTTQVSEHEQINGELK